MKTTYFIIVISFVLMALSCDSKVSEAPLGNPPAKGFNLADSDEQAIIIADEVMDAMGGQIAWDTTRYINWTFFGRRNHIWDKKVGRSMIDIPSDSLSIWIDLNSKTGRVEKRGVELTQPDSISKFVESGFRMWINDSYWLVMPFKLKDSGVTLKYVGQDTTTTGAKSDILELTFSEVGVTPDNKYLVYVDENSRLVTQWDYYANYNDSIPRFQSSWPEYKKYGDLLLSGGEIRGNRMSNISVSQHLQDSPFGNDN